MVRSQSTLIFIVLGAASISVKAAPFKRFAPVVETGPEKDAASCAFSSQDIPESGHSQDCSFEGELSAFPGHLIDTKLQDSSQFSLVDPMSPHSSSLHVFHSLQVHEVIDVDSVSIPSLDSRTRAPRPPDPLAAVTHPTGVLLPPSPLSAPIARPLSRVRTYTDVARDPSIESRPRYPSDLNVDVHSTIASGVLPPTSPTVGYAPVADSDMILQKRTDSDITSGHNIESRIVHPSSSSGPLNPLANAFSAQGSETTANQQRTADVQKKPTDALGRAAKNPPSPMVVTSSGPFLNPLASEFSTKSSAATTPNQQTTTDSVQEKIDAIIAAQSPPSPMVVSSSGPFLNPPASAFSAKSSYSAATTPVQQTTGYVQQKKNAIIAATPPSPMVVSSSFAYNIVSERLSDNSPPSAVRDSLESYSQSQWLADIGNAHITNWNQFLETDSGKLWQDTDRLLSSMRPKIDRDSVRFLIISQIIRAHLGPARDGKWTAKNVHEELTKWNYPQYWSDMKAPQDEFFARTETGQLVRRICRLIQKSTHIQVYPELRLLILEDMRGGQASVNGKTAELGVGNTKIQGGNVGASQRAARGVVKKT
ncbi:hypothetical protein EV361DRAFT_963728 [Lentinula raphanica]|nr:hypothetical protein EV361DRAFT_963728 [Lentinula raphanica]